MENGIQVQTPKRSKKKNTIFAVAAIGVTVGLGIVTMLASPARAWQVSGPKGMLFVNDYYDIEVDLSEVKDHEIIIPDSIDGVAVTSVRGGYIDPLFQYDEHEYGISNLVSITLPDTVDDLMNFFSYPLMSIDFPDGVYLRSYAFAFCNRLSEVTLPVNGEVSEGVFKGCESLEKVTIPNGVEYISRYCFQRCTSLEKVELPDSVEKIETYSFADCTALEYIELNNVEIIECYAFENCISLKEIEIPDSVTNINSGAFKGCTALETITIPASVKHLDNSVFENCTSLKSVFVSYDTEIDTETLATWHFAVKRY